MNALTLDAPAKLNLYLHLMGRRPDGYHLLESLVVFTDLADELIIEAADELSLTLEGSFASAAGEAADNLVLKAARALLRHTNSTHGARIKLTKNIPVGAGLGGGSADAAAALRGLNRLWGLGLSDGALASIGLTLGADVPLCLAGKPTIMRGIGEQLAPLNAPLPTLTALLVYPNAPLATRAVYEACATLPMPSAAPWQPVTGDAQSFIASLAPTRNQLQRAAIGLSEQVVEVLFALETLVATADFVRMTGSGACCFALFANASDAQAAHAQIAREHPNWFSGVARVAA